MNSMSISQELIVRNICSLQTIQQNENNISIIKTIFIIFSLHHMILVLHWSWDESLEISIVNVTKHTVSFPWTSLSISEDRTIVAIHYICYCLAANKFIYFTLRRIWIKHGIHCKYCWFRHQNYCLFIWIQATICA